MVHIVLHRRPAMHFTTIAVSASVAPKALAATHAPAEVRDWSHAPLDAPNLAPDLATQLPLLMQSNDGLLLALLGFVLVASLLQGSLAIAFRSLPANVPPRRPDQPAVQDSRHSCQLLFAHLESIYREAEKAVMKLAPGTPLQSLLLGELNQIAHQLRMIPDQFDTGRNAISVSEHPVYWRNLARRLRAAVRDLNRVCEVAAAGGVTFGQEQNEPSIPRTLEEAYLVIGANRDVDEAILKRLVRALRQCWHPDLAHDAKDKKYREARIRQINVAVELITGQRRET